MLPRVSLSLQALLTTPKPTQPSLAGLGGQIKTKQHADLGCCEARLYLKGGLTVNNGIALFYAPPTCCRLKHLSRLPKPHFA